MIKMKLGFLIPNILKTFNQLKIENKDCLRQNNR